MKITKTQQPVRQDNARSVSGFDIEEVANEAEAQRKEIEIILGRLRFEVKRGLREAGTNQTVLLIDTKGVWSKRRNLYSYYWRMEVLESVVKLMQSAQKGAWTVRLAPASESICFFKKPAA